MPWRKTEKLNLKRLNMKKLVLLSTTVLCMFTAPALFAQMDHSGMGGMDHSGHQHGLAPGDQAPLPQPAQTVFQRYLKIETTLSQDSIQGISDNAMALMEAIRRDSSKTFSPEIAQAAEDLAKAKNIETARQVFRRLSDNLIKHLEANKEHAARFEKVFCSMANAKWLQKAGTPVSNPYLGKSMATCGQIQS